MELKIGWRTGPARKNHPQVFHGLQQRFGLPADRRGLFAAQSGAKTIQLPMQLTPEPIDCFQGERQLHFFGRGFERKPRQRLQEPLPHQRSSQGVTRQNIRQKDGKSAPATATPPAIGTKHPLATNTLAAGLCRIVAAKNTVPVQGFNFPAAGAALLLERKSRVFNSSLSRTK